MMPLRPPTEPAISGFILAGGRSLRFGSDKALALLRGRPLISYPISALREMGIAPIVVAPDADRYREWCANGVTNERPGNGPVEGVRAALLASMTPWAFVLSVDMPFVGRELLEALRSRIERSPTPDAVCFVDSNGRRHPFPGLYSRTLLELLDGPLDGGARATAARTSGRGGRSRSSSRVGDSVRSLLEAARVDEIHPGHLDGSIDLAIALVNVNRRADLPA